MTKKYTVLVDNCVIQCGVVIEPAVKRRILTWGGKNSCVDIHGYAPKPKLKDNEQWKQEQINCLPTIARLAQEKHIDLYTYDELHMESIQASMGCNGLRGDIFSPVEFKQALQPIERSKFFQMELDEYLKKQTVQQFCEFLIHVDVKKMKTLPILNDFERKNLKAIGQFKALCSQLSATHYPDALHLWTGEINNLDFFLTIDKKFINAITESCNVKFHCKPISPDSLLNLLAVAERDSVPFRNCDFISVAQATKK